MPNATFWKHLLLKSMSMPNSKSKFSECKRPFPLDDIQKLNPEEPIPYQLVEVNRIAQEINQLKVSPAIQPEVLEGMQQRLNIMQELAGVEDLNSELKQQNFRLRKQLNEKCNPHHVSLSKCNSNLVAIKGDFKEKRRKYKEQIKHLKNKVDELSQQLAKSQSLEERTKIENAAKNNIPLCTHVTQCNLLDAETFQDMKNQVSLLLLKSARVKELEQKVSMLQKSKGDHKSAEKYLKLVQLDRDRLRLKLDEMAIMQKEYKDLKSKFVDFENVNKKLQIYKDKAAMLEKRLHNTLAISNADGGSELQKEKHQLEEKVRHLQELVASQEDEISRLILHLDRLVQNLESQQSKSKSIVNGLRDEIERKALCITDMNSQLENLQEQLRQIIDDVSKESVTMQEKIKNSEAAAAKLGKQLNEKDAEITKLKGHLEKEVELKKNFLVEMAQIKAGNLENLAKGPNSDGAYVTYESYEFLENLLKRSQLALRKAAKQFSAKSA